MHGFVGDVSSVVVCEKFFVNLYRLPSHATLAQMIVILVSLFLLHLNRFCILACFACTSLFPFLTPCFIPPPYPFMCSFLQCITADKRIALRSVNHSMWQLAYCIACSPNAMCPAVTLLYKANVRDVRHIHLDFPVRVSGCRFARTTPDLSFPTQGC